MNHKTIILGLAIVPILLQSQTIDAQEKITDQVAVIVMKNRIYAATTEEGLTRVELAAGEEVLAVEARGINALVQTSTRLLGFSAKTQRWAEQRTDLYEQILEKQVTPRLIFVKTNKRLYGFQGLAGRWNVEELGAREELRAVTVKDHLLVAVTERRAGSNQSSTSWAAISSTSVGSPFSWRLRISGFVSTSPT